MRRREEVRHAASSENVCTPLRITIPFTSDETARAALHAAVGMAGDLGATVTIAAVHVVPYPLPLDRPDIGRGHFLHRLEELFSSSEVPVRVLMVLTRDKRSAIRRMIPAGSVVVLATRKHWWRTEEETLARVLRRDGRRVVLIRPEPGEREPRRHEVRESVSDPVHCLREGKSHRA